MVQRDPITLGIAIKLNDVVSKCVEIQNAFGGLQAKSLVKKLLPFSRFRPAEYIKIITAVGELTEATENIRALFQKKYSSHEQDEFASVFSNYVEAFLEHLSAMNALAFYLWTSGRQQDIKDSNRELQLRKVFSDSMAKYVGIGKILNKYCR